MRVGGGGEGRGRETGNLCFKSGDVINTVDVSDEFSPPLGH